MAFRRPPRRRAPEQQLPLDGIAGDILAAYVAEGLVEGNFVPSGESEHERRTSIEARAYMNWLAREDVKNEVYMMSPEECRQAFHRRNYWEKKPTPEATVEQKQNFGAAFEDHQRKEVALTAARQRAREARATKDFTPAAASMPAEFQTRGDAYEPKPAEDDDTPPPAE